MARKNGWMFGPWPAKEVSHGVNGYDAMNTIKFEDRLVEVQKAVNKLSELFDTVQIFVTSHEPVELDGTATHANGTGNFYARIGHVQEWLQQKDVQAAHEIMREDARRRDDDEFNDE